MKKLIVIPLVILMTQCTKDDSLVAPAENRPENVTLHEQKLASDPDDPFDPTNNEMWHFAQLLPWEHDNIIGFAEGGDSGANGQYVKECTWVCVKQVADFWRVKSKERVTGVAGSFPFGVDIINADHVGSWLEGFTAGAISYDEVGSSMTYTASAILPNVTGTFSTLGYTVSHVFSKQIGTFILWPNGNPAM